MDITSWRGFHETKGLFPCCLTKTKTKLRSYHIYQIQNSSSDWEVLTFLVVLWFCNCFWHWISWSPRALYRRYRIFTHTLGFTLYLGFTHWNFTHTLGSHYTYIETPNPLVYQKQLENSRAHSLVSSPIQEVHKCSSWCRIISTPTCMIHFSLLMNRPLTMHTHC